MKKTYIIIGVVYFIITTSLIIYLFINREIVIKYPKVTVPKTEVTITTSNYVIEKHNVIADSVKIDSLENELQYYTHTISDSNFSLKQSVIVNTSKKKADWKDSLSVRKYETVKTITDSIIVQKIESLPFYKDDWFWYSITITALFFGSLFAIIFG